MFTGIILVTCLVCSDNYSTREERLNWQRKVYDTHTINKMIDADEKPTPLPVRKPLTEILPYHYPDASGLDSPDLIDPKDYLGDNKE